jgi:hypothetical protein
VKDLASRVRREGFWAVHGYERLLLSENGASRRLSRKLNRGRHVSEQGQSLSVGFWSVCALIRATVDTDNAGSIRVHRALTVVSFEIAVDVVKIALWTRSSRSLSS